MQYSRSVKRREGKKVEKSKSEVDAMEKKDEKNHILPEQKRKATGNKHKVAERNNHDFVNQS